MNCHSFWRYVFLGLHSITLLGVMILVSAKMPNNSGKKISETELQSQLASKTLYLDNVNWVLSKKPDITIIDNQVADGINVVFYEVKDTKNIRLADPKFSLKEGDKNDNVLVKMKAFCKSLAENVKGRVIITKTSVIDSMISE